MTSGASQITYEQAQAAYHAGYKLHHGGRIYLVRPALRDGAMEGGAEEAPVLWVTDQRTLGDHGLILYPDGRVVAR